MKEQVTGKELDDLIKKLRKKLENSEFSIGEDYNKIDKQLGVLMRMQVMEQTMAGLAKLLKNK